MPGKEIKGRSPIATYRNGGDVTGDGQYTQHDKLVNLGVLDKPKNMKKGGKVKKGLYYYMNRAKKRGTSKPGKGTVTDKALKRSAKTAKKS